MSLDTAKFIGQLDVASPAPGDAKGQGDDHIRVSKAAARNSFPGFTGVILAAGTDTGVSNTYVLNPATPLQEYSKNMGVLWFPSNTNGGASTITISGLGAVPIKRQNGTALTNGDIMAGQPLLMVWTGTEFRIAAVTQQAINQLVFSGALPGQTGNAGKALVTDGVNASFSNAFGVAMDEAKGADIGAAPVINLTSGAGTGNLVHITGSGANIGTITLPSGAERTLVFEGVNTLVASGNLTLPGPGNITTAAGDTAIIRGDGSAARVIDYNPKSGRPVVEQTPPGWVLLTPTPVVPTAGVTAIDFLNIFSTTYDDYVIVLNDIRPSAFSGQTTLLVQLAFNAVVDGASVYGGINQNEIPAGYASGNGYDTRIYLGWQASASDDSYQSRANGQIQINNANGSCHFFSSSGFSSLRDSGGAFTPSAPSRGGFHINNNLGTYSASGFRLLLQGPATFAATGSIKVYGIRKA